MIMQPPFHSLFLPLLSRLLPETCPRPFSICWPKQLSRVDIYGRLLSTCFEFVNFFHCIALRIQPILPQSVILFDITYPLYHNVCIWRTSVNPATIALGAPNRPSIDQTTSNLPWSNSTSGSNVVERGIRFLIQQHFVKLEKENISQLDHMFHSLG